VRLNRQLLAVVISIVSVVALVGACTSAPTPSSGGASPSAGSGSASNPTGSTSAPAGALVINIAIKNGKVTPNGDKINVHVGQTVLMNVTSDSADEVHAHTSGNGYELEVKAGVPISGRFVAADSGSFEIESHHLNKIIAILEVR
jgi:hypothetical protein